MQKKKNGEVKRYRWGTQKTNKNSEAQRYRLECRRRRMVKLRDRAGKAEEEEVAPIACLGTLVTSTVVLCCLLCQA